MVLCGAESNRAEPDRPLVEHAAEPIQEANGGGGDQKRSLKRATFQEPFLGKIVILLTLTIQKRSHMDMESNDKCFIQSTISIPALVFKK